MKGRQAAFRRVERTALEAERLCDRAEIIKHPRILDQDYFKLKIRQTAVPEPPLALFPKVRELPHASA
jgi:hypothetical protein